MVAYLKNCSLNQKGVTPYKGANEEKPDLKHLRAIGSWACVYVSEMLKKKLTDRAR